MISKIRPTLSFPFLFFTKETSKFTKKNFLFQPNAQKPWKTKRSEARGPPQLQEKRSRSERAILGALGEFRGILGAALILQELILGIRNSILGMASHDLSNTKTTILGATPGAIPGIDGNTHERNSFALAFSERFFKNWGGSREPEEKTRLLARKVLAKNQLRKSKQNKGEGRTGPALLWPALGDWERSTSFIDDRQITHLIFNSVQTKCIVKGEAQKSPLFWRFSGGFWFSQDRLFSRNSTRKPLKLIKSPIFTNTPCKSSFLYNAPSMHTVEICARRKYDLYDFFRGCFWAFYTRKRKEISPKHPLKKSYRWYNRSSRTP